MAAESKTERRVRELAAATLGVNSIKIGFDGWPDRLFIIPGGRPLWIEFKAPGEKPGPRQEFRLACLRLWGYGAEVHDDVDRAIQAIARAVAAARLPEEGGQVPP